MFDPVWLPFWTAVIGALAVLAGTVVSPMFGARSSHKQWLRDKRAERFEGYYVMLSQALEQAEFYQGLYGRLLRKELDPVVSGDLSNSAASLDLYATTTVGAAAREAAEAYDTWGLLVTQASVPPFADDTRINIAFEDFRTKAHKAQNRIRAELKVK